MIPDELKGFPDAQAVEAHDRASLVGGRHDRGELTLQIAPQKIVAVCRFLKAERGYNLLSDLTATDGYPLEPRFQVVYHLYATEGRQNLRLKASLPGNDPRVDTVTTEWPAAGWFEREVFDLFGIVFTGHPDLRRILMPDNWQGHPLRKDYPTEGIR